MARTMLPWLLAGGTAAAIIYYGTRSAKDRAVVGNSPDGRSDDLPDPAVRNASLSYRPVGATGDRYPAWVRALRGKSGVYIIRERQRDGSTPVVYVGESHAGRLYQTLTRHFQMVRHEAQEDPMT